MNPLSLSFLATLLCLPSITFGLYYANGTKTTYERIPSWYLDDEIVYNFLEIWPNETMDFIEDLTDNEFNEYTAILVTVSQIANETYDEEEDEFRGTFTPQDLESAARKISPKIYEKLKAVADNIQEAINRLPSQSAQSTMNTLSAYFCDLRPKMWHRRYFLEVLFKAIRAVEESSQTDRKLIEEYFPSITTFVDAEITKVLYSKKTTENSCTEEEILQEMVDEAKYQQKNYKPMTENTVSIRTVKGTTARCDHVYVSKVPLDW